jgi:hypothetical protein
LVYGAKDDVNQFDICCDEIRRASPGLFFDTDQLGKEAAGAVAKDLSDAAVLAELAIERKWVEKVLRSKMYPASVL